MISVKEDSELLRLTPKILRLWEKKRKIISHRTESAHRRYEITDLYFRL